MIYFKTGYQRKQRQLPRLAIFAGKRLRIFTGYSVHYPTKIHGSKPPHTGSGNAIPGIVTVVRADLCSLPLSTELSADRTHRGLRGIGTDEGIYSTDLHMTGMPYAERYMDVLERVGGVDPSFGLYSAAK